MCDNHYKIERSFDIKNSLMEFSMEFYVRHLARYGVSETKHYNAIGFDDYSLIFVLLNMEKGMQTLNMLQQIDKDWN